MNDFTRERALILIRKTMFEFHRDVMIPLNRNIHQYDRETHAEAVCLHEDFHGFSEFVDNVYDDVSESSAEIEGMNNFEMSQLLSLCRDIGELFALPVYDMMPDFIPGDNLLNSNPCDPAPLCYVAPGAQNTFRNSPGHSWMSGLNRQFFEMAENGINHPLGLIQYDSHLNKFFLMPININQNLDSTSTLLKNYLNSLYSNLTTTYDIYENIKGNLSTVSNYISKAEWAVNFITGTIGILHFLDALLPYFSDAKSQVDNLLQYVDALNFERLGNDLSNRSLEDIFVDLASAIRALLTTTENKLATLPEHDSDIVFDETAVSKGWVERAWNATKGGIATAVNGLSWFVNFLSSTHLIGENFTWKLIPPEASLDLPDGKLSASTGGIAFTYLIYQDSDTTTRGGIEVSVDIVGDDPSFSVVGRENYEGRKSNLDIASTVNVSNDEVNFLVDWSTLFNARGNLSFGANITTMPFSTSNRMFSIEPATERGITSFRINWINFLKMGVFIRLRF